MEVGYVGHKMVLTGRESKNVARRREISGWHMRIGALYCINIMSI